MALLNFKYGLQSALPARSAAELGCVYVTTDSQRMFVALPDQTDYVNLGDFHLVSYAGSDNVTALSTLTALPASIKRTNILYLTVDTANNDATALYRYNGTSFVPISNTVEIADMQADIEELKTEVQTVKNNYMPKTGGAFSGEITIPATSSSSSNTAAATKKYVDDAKAGALADAKAYTNEREAAIMGTTNSETGSATVYGVKKKAEANASAIDALDKELDTLTGTVGGKAPIYHANEETTYGIGTGSLYGHVQLSDSTSSSSAASAGIAATPKAVKAAYDKGAEGLSRANAAYTKAETNETAISTINTNLAGYVKKDGTVAMTGALTLAGDPTAGSNQAATAKYVDAAKVSAISTAAEDATNKANAVLGDDQDTSSDKTVYGAHAAAAAALSAANTAQTTANGKAPTNHASTATTYGVGTTDKYGHVKLSDTASTGNAVAQGVAATPKAVADAKSAVIGASGDASSANTIYGAKKYAEEKVASVSSELSTLKDNIGNLSNIMNFLGTTTTELTNGSTTASVSIGGTVTTAVKGDVVVYGSKEFVFDGSKWAEIGDVSAQASAISDLQERMTTAEGDIDKVEGRLDTAEDDIDALEKWKDEHQTEYNNLEGRMDTAESDIDDLQATVGTKPSSPTMDTTLWEEVADLRSDLGESNAASGTTSAFARIRKAETAIGASGDTASASGSLYARSNYANSSITTINTTIGSSSDAASNTGSLYARIKDNDELIASLTTLLTWGEFK